VRTPRSATTNVATYGKGYAPPCIKLGSLVAYFPMIADTTSLKDRFSSTVNNLTLTAERPATTHR
jgi:hypothetical protein